MTDRLNAALAELVEALREEIREVQSPIEPAGPVELIDVATFARRAGIGRSTAWLEVSGGRVRSTKVRGRRLIPSTELSRLAATAHEKAVPAIVSPGTARGGRRAVVERPPGA